MLNITNVLPDPALANTSNLFRGDSGPIKSAGGRWVANNDPTAPI